MKQIFFRKIQPYDPTFGGKYSRYLGYGKITLQEDCPGIMHPTRFTNIPSLPYDVILCSQLKRGMETAQAMITAKRQSIKTIPTLLCNEVLFQLSSLVTEAEFEAQGSSLVRERFITHFIQDMLREKRDSLKRRLDLLQKYLFDLPAANYLLISHSFFMKVAEAYFSDPDFFDTPEKIRLYIDPHEKTYPCGAGFDVMM